MTNLNHKNVIVTAIAFLALAFPLTAGSHSSSKADIVDTAVAAGSFNTLLAAAKAAGLVEALEGHDRTLFIQSLIATPEICREYEDAGFPCFEDPSRAVSAMAALMFFGTEFDKGRPPAPEIPAVDPLPDGTLGEKEAKAVLAGFGLPMVEDVLATNAEEAVAAAQKAGGPVAMKIASPLTLSTTEP